MNEQVTFNVDPGLNKAEIETSIGTIEISREQLDYVIEALEECRRVLDAE